jgi:hypothetical protein
MIESAFEGKRSVLESASEGKRSMLEQCFRALSGFKARSSNDFECSVASREKEACSSSYFERSVAFRRYKKQARAMISSARDQKASSSSDFERPVATEHVRAMISSAQSKILRVCSVSECCRGSLGFSTPTRAENLYSYIYTYIYKQVLRSNWCPDGSKLLRQHSKTPHTRSFFD